MMIAMRTVLLTLLLLILPHGLHAADVSISVVDGDTIRTDLGKVRFRYCDAPETFFSKCPAEREWGDRATARLRALIANGREVWVDLGPTPRREKWRRWLGVLWIDGEDACAILIREDLAVPYSGGKRRSWCP